jgi:hypothetical protein
MTTKYTKLTDEHRRQALDGQVLQFESQAYDTELNLKRLRTLPAKLKDAGVEAQIAALETQAKVIEHSIKVTKDERGKLPEPKKSE